MMHSPVSKGHAVLFVENREKTRFWAGVAAVLAEQGVAVHWLVQNHLFGADLPGEVHEIPYPRQELGVDVDWAERYPILITDRGRQHFKAGAEHYSHYASHIRQVIKHVSPQLVIGESTLFHELLSVAIAEELGIPFIHPAAERYPQDRFVMFSGTSQTAFVSSGSLLPAEHALSFARRVREGTERPIYMARLSGMRKLARRAKWIWTRASIWAARMSGERYNTPSMTRKWQLSRVLKRNLGQWQGLARHVPAGARAIMYPMHIAPEANIDVWGRPFNDQFALIKRMLAACPPGAMVAVKANPSPKYELSDDLIALAKSEPRLVLLPLAMPMQQAMEQCVGAITVSGMVGFEAVFGSGRCLSLCHPIIEQTCPEFATATPEEGIARLLNDPASGCGNDAAAVALLQGITARSFEGLISDPFSTPSCLDSDNVRKVAAGITRALQFAAERPAEHELSA